MYKPVVSLAHARHVFPALLYCGEVCQQSYHVGKCIALSCVGCLDLDLSGKCVDHVISHRVRRRESCYYYHDFVSKSAFSAGEYAPGKKLKKTD